MAVGTSISTETFSNFDFLQNTKGDQQLKIKVELGYLNIPTNSSYPSYLVEQNVNNPFFPVQGGKQAETFVLNSQLRKLKSNTLKPMIQGVMPPHIDVSGAPYCTFLAGTIKPSSHPYYDLIKAPADAPTEQATAGSLNFVQGSPTILNQFFQANNSADTENFNKIGSVFIPSTTKTSSAVSAANLSSLDTYNIWTVDNISKEYFDFKEYLGWIPKNDATVDKLQPYAQTWSYSDTAQIQVYASNSQVTLTRQYPIAKDYAHHKNSKYLIFNSATTESPQLEVNPINLSSEAAVGFVLKFSSVVVSNNPPTQANTGDKVILAEPRLIVSWGDIDATRDRLAKYTKEEKIGKYTLEISPGRPPRLFFNMYFDSISDIERSDNIQANIYSVELNNLKEIVSSDKNSGAKSPNDYELYVFYSGEFLTIGNSKDSSSWQVIRNQIFPAKNKTQNSAAQPKRKLKHYLDKNSRINIQAQFMNFVYSYGPVLFTPYDDQNIPAFVSNSEENLANGLSYVTGKIPANTDDPNATNAEELKESTLNFIKQNSLKTFGEITEDQSRSFGGASAYIDARTSEDASNFNAVYKKINGSNLLEFKITFPKTLGGNILNKVLPLKGEFPDIKDTYSYYDLKIYQDISELESFIGSPPQEENISVSDFLTQTVSRLEISSSLDEATSSYVTSQCNIDFLNLNRSDIGLKILQFMRHNVCVLRISAGYQFDTFGRLPIFFEGMIEGIDISESLDRSLISVSAKDLLTKLFNDPESLIMSQSRLDFPGMYFKDIIEYLYKYTELYGHFKYDLGSRTDKDTIMYQLYECKPLPGLPKLPDTLSANLGKIEVLPYSTSETYFQALMKIRDFLIQVKTTKGKSKKCQSERFDIPVYAWYTDAINNGIVMTSRTLEKDGDAFYIRKEDITELMTKDINDLHGYVYNKEFTSKSTTELLFARGLFRGIDIDNVPYQVQTGGSLDKYVPPLSKDITQFEKYVGYDKIVLFDKPDEIPSMQTTVGNNLLNEDEAQIFIDKWFDSVYDSVYEQISLQVLINKPLKIWGYFNVFIENTIVDIDYLYLYNNIQYNFDLDNNIIIASVEASRRPLMEF